MITNRRDLIALKSSVLSNLFAFELLFLLLLFVFFGSMNGSPILGIDSRFSEYLAPFSSCIVDLRPWDSGGFAPNFWVDIFSQFEFPLNFTSILSVQVAPIVSLFLDFG